MALPFQFANVTTLVTSQLDANYNALGALTPIPCSSSGSNVVTLTPLANTPTVSAYSNYIQFTFISASSNTSTTTAAVGALAALAVYKDTGAGPIQLSGGEIVQNCQYTIIYDSSLGGGSGGFHLKNGATLSVSGGTITGPVVFNGPVMVGSAANSSLSNVVSTSSSIAWANIPAASASIATIALTGCSVGDCVFLGTPASVPTGIAFFGWVSAAGTVTLQAINETGSSLTPVAGTYRVVAQRFS